MPHPHQDDLQAMLDEAAKPGPLAHLAPSDADTPIDPRILAAFTSGKPASSGKPATFGRGFAHHV